MNERNLRPGNVGAAAVVIGGVLMVAFPGHAVAIVELVLVTAAAATALYALVLNVPPTGWMSPFKWMSPFTRKRLAVADGGASDELDLIRSRMSGRRRSVEGGPPLPPDTVRLLKPLIGAALDLDPGAETYPDSARTLVSPLTWAVFTGEAPTGSGWLHTLRPSEPDVAELVHAVLDDLDRLGPDTRSHHDPENLQPRAQ